MRPIHTLSVPPVTTAPTAIACQGVGQVAAVTDTAALALVP